jgi:putative oxidoreductase
MSNGFHPDAHEMVQSTEKKLNALGEELINTRGIDLRMAAYAILLMRVSMGLLFLAHACLKLFVFKMDGTVQFFESLGLPGFMAYVAILMEVIGGAMLVGGMYVRLVAIILSLDLWGAVFMVHGKAGFWFTNQGGGWEYPVFWILMLYALALLGSGAYSYDAFQEQDRLSRDLKQKTGNKTSAVTPDLMNTDTDEFNTLLEVSEHEYLKRKQQKQNDSSRTGRQPDSFYDEKMVYQYNSFWFVE